MINLFNDFIWNLFYFLIENDLLIPLLSILSTGLIVASLYQYFKLISEDLYRGLKNDDAKLKDDFDYGHWKEYYKNGKNIK